MAVTVVEPANRPAPRPTRGTGGVGIHSGQIVVTQAAAALSLAATGRGSLTTIALAGAAITLFFCWVRIRRRWLYQWLGVLARYLFRRRSLRAGADADALLGWIRPGARLAAGICDGEPAGIIEGTAGLTALLELGQSDGLLAEAATPLPPLPALHSPGVRLHLVVTGMAPVAGTGAPAASYRQLTEGRLLARQRAVLAVQALRVEGTGDDEVRRVLSSAVRRIRRRLRDTLGAHLLTEPAVRAVLAELAHHDGTPVREGWHAVHIGGLLQATYRVRRWPRDSAPGLVPHLLTLPAAATTVALTIGADDRAALAVRLAAPTPAALTGAAKALRRVLDGHGATAQRCDGEQARALAGTLPTGYGHSGRTVAHEVLTRLAPAVGGAGLMLGVNRQNEPVTAQVFRAEATRALAVGGVRIAQLLTLRTLALGAQVVVQSARPQAWEAFVRAVSTPADPVVLVPPGPLPATLGVPGSPLRPQLVIVDVGPVSADGGVLDAPWRTVLIVRDDLAAGDLDLLARSDLLVLQPLRADEAALAAGALGLGAAGEWLTRIRGDMVGVVNRHAVRWALLSATQVEQQLFGPFTRG